MMFVWKDENQRKKAVAGIFKKIKIVLSLSKT